MNGDGYDPAAHGCTGRVGFDLMCGSQATVVVSGVHGRRCADHAPVSAAHLIDAWPADRALELVDAQPRLAWLRVHLPALLGGTR